MTLTPVKTVPAKGVSAGKTTVAIAAKGAQKPTGSKTGAARPPTASSQPRAPVPFPVKKANPPHKTVASPAVPKKASSLQAPPHPTPRATKAPHPTPRLTSAVQTLQPPPPPASPSDTSTTESSASSSSPRMRRLSHIATLEPVVSGKAHTIFIDKTMLMGFKSVTNWDSSIPTRLRGEKTNPAICLALPCFTRETCADIVQDAERAAERDGGWRARAVGCCTADVLVSDLSSAMRQRIHAAFEQNVMPVVAEVYPKARLNAKSLPPKPNHFFIIKYTAEKSPAFGLHARRARQTRAAPLAGGVASGGPGRRTLLTSPPWSVQVDHTAVTVNVALSEDFEGGGTFIRASTATAVTESARSSMGVCLRPRAGMALVHNGEVPHAGNAVTRGRRCARTRGRH